MKTKTLPELLSEVLKHEDMPEDLRTDLWNFLNDRSDVDSTCPEWIALMLGVPFVIETNKPLDLSTPDGVKDYKKLQLEQMAKKIILILESENVSPKIQDAIFAIAQEAIINAEDSTTRTELINERFVRAMLSHDVEYTKAVLSSLGSVMEETIDENVYQKILNKSLGR